MKSKLSLALLATLAVAPLASADTEIRFTGSTAFRAAVHAALLNSFFTGSPAYAHSGAAGAVSGASKSIWRGSVTGIAGTTTVRCTWSGSAQGISDVTSGNNVSFLQASVLPGSGESAGQTTSENLAAHGALSDVGQNSTVFSTPTLDDVGVGVVPFTWVVNDTSATGATVAARYGFDNISAQFVRALFSSGSQPKSMLTGNAADTKLIYAAGRDTGSGTRITMLAETKYGIFTPVQQFQITAASDAVTELRVWPTGTTGGNDLLAGNGGYTSGGTLSGLLANKSDTGFILRNAAGTQVGGTQPSCHIVACVGIADSANTTGGGGARLKYEGVGYDYDGNNDPENDKIRQGQYTLWGYQHMLTGTLDVDQTTARDALVTAIDANVGAAGIASSTMAVFRQEDGGVVGP